MKRILFILTIVLSIGFIFSACNNKSKASTLAKDEVYSCSMHQQIAKEKPGQCPICNMDLEKRKMTQAEHQKMHKYDDNYYDK